MRFFTKFLFLMLFMFLSLNSIFSQADIGRLYRFSSSAGSYTPLSSGTNAFAITGAALDQDISSIITIPNMNYGVTTPNGTTAQVCNRMYICANGFITIGPSTLVVPPTSITIGSAIHTSGGMIAGFSKDLAGIDATSNVLYSISGTDVTVEFKNMMPWSTTGWTINYQIILHTATGVIDIVYGNCVAPALTTTTGQIGIRGNSTTFPANSSFRTITNSTSTAIPYVANNFANTSSGIAATTLTTMGTSATVLNGVPVSGQKYTFTPVAITDACSMPASTTAPTVSTTAGSVGNVPFVWTPASPVAASGYEVQWRPIGSTGAYSSASVAAGVLTYTIPAASLTPTTAYEIMVRGKCSASVSSEWFGTRTFISACGGTPTVGTHAASVVGICTGATTTLTTTGSTPTTITGIAYQWEESDDNGATDAWANAVGGTATTASYTTPAFVGPTIYYRLKVTCNASALSAYSTGIQLLVQAPTVQASNIAVTTTGGTSLAISSTAGNGGRRAIFINSSNTFTDPTNGVSPGTAATVWANAGQQLVADGTGTTVTVTGLTPGTTYYFRVYDYNQCTAPNNYFLTTTATNNPNNFATLSNINYEVNRSTGVSYNSIMATGTTYSGTLSSGDDAVTASTPIGFNFIYQGQTCTNFRACTNGFMTLDGTTSTSTSYTNNLGVNTSTQKAILAPFWDDLVILGNLATNKDACMRYLLSGSAPNRILTIEWKDIEKWNYAGPNLNFQVKLYEGTNNIEYVYGNMSPFDGTKDVAFTYSIGMTGFQATTLAAGENMVQTNSDTKMFSGPTNTTMLNLPPSCYSSLLFTPGTYTAGSPNAAPTNEDCATALPLAVSSTVPTEYCQIFRPGSSADASAPACGAATPGNPDDDVWFSFTPAINSTVTLDIRPAGGYNPAVQLFSGACGSLTSLNCVNANAAPATATINSGAVTTAESLVQMGLTGGTTYYFRVYHVGTGGFSGSFDNGTSSASAVTPIEAGFAASVFTTPDPPINDNCAAATTLTLGATCVTTSGTTVAGTASSQTTCGGSPTQDVWYKFTAPTAGTQVKIDVQGGTGFNAHLELWNGGASPGDCATMTTVLGSCTNATSTAGLESYTSTALIPGNVYYVRVYHTTGGQGGQGLFTICAVESCPALTTPTISSITQTTASVVWTGAGNVYVEYGLAGFTPGTSATAGTGGTIATGSPFATSPAALSGLVANTSYDVYIRKDCGSGFSANSPIANFTTLEACPKPTSPAVGSITSTSASVSWTCVGCTEPIIVEYGLTGFTPGIDGTPGTGGTIWSPAPTASPQVITGLLPSTDYNVYIRKDCSAASNGYSSNTAVVAFSTPAPPPSNDDPCAATSLVLGTQICQNTSSATVGTQETTSNLATVWTGSTLNNTVFFKYTPTSTGVFELVMSSPASSTQVMQTWAGIYTTAGCPTGPLTFTQVLAPASSSTIAGTATTTVTPILTAGTEYTIMIDGFSSSFGDFCITLNESCSNNSGIGTLVMGVNPLTTMCGVSGAMSFYGLTDGAGNNKYCLGVNWGTSAANLAAKAYAEASGTGRINVYQNTANYGPTGTAGVGLTHTLNSYWNVDIGTNQLDAPVTVRFYFDPAKYAALVGIAGANPPVWFKTITPAGQSSVAFDASSSPSNPVTGQWAGMQQLTYSTLNPTLGFVEFPGVTGFSGGSVSVSEIVTSPLPINLKSFSASEKGNANVINWETAVEQNVRNFVVEKSNNGSTWTTVGTKSPDASKRYMMIDASPFPTSYYRLKNVDKDGRFDYSTIVVVERNTGKFTFTSVTPNPTSYDLNVKFETAENAEIKLNVIDILGKVVLIQNIEALKGINTVTVNTSVLPAGAYFLNINNGVNTLTQRIVKQ